MSRKKNPKKTKMKKRLRKINDAERKRLGSSGVVNTRCFRERQTFGAGSEVRHIDPKELSPEELQRLVSR
jgi:hypothetical protein